MLFTFWDVQLEGIDNLMIGIRSHQTMANTVMTVNDQVGFPNTLTLNTSNAWIIFRSDGEKRAKGFSIEIQNVEKYGKFIYSRKKENKLIK